MSIYKIYIKDREGNSLGVLSGKCRVVPGNSGLVIAADASEGLASISSPAYDDIFTGAREQISTPPGVHMINSTEPADDGAFFINGSACISWSLRDDEETSTSGLLPESWGVSKSSLFINDLCSSCTSCDATLRLKKAVEYYKIAYNTLKDVNLYVDSIVRQRQAYLETKRISITDRERELLDPELLTTMELRSNRLLGQYLTVVHMWNYIATRHEHKTVVGQSSEDASGMYIYSKFPKTACDGVSDISCTVAVELVSGQEGLSVYVPDAEMSFEPFTYDGGAAFACAVVVNSASGGSITLARTNGGRAGTKVGTYLLKARWLPFYAVKQELAEGVQLDPETYNMTEVSRTVTPDTERGGTTVSYNNLAISTAKFQINGNATKDDYIKYRRYLSTASSQVNRWKVTVTWTTTGTGARSVTENYYYETPGVREPLTGIYRNTVLHNPGVTE